MNEVSSFLTQFLIVSGGAAGIAYLLFTWLGKKWLDTKFDQRLEAYRRAQAEELESYRYKVKALFSRVSKIHEKEFEVLPAAWRRLQDALGPVNDLTSILQSYPDLDRMTPGELDHFVSDSELIEAHKEELLQAPRKTDFYVDKIFWYRINNAKRKHTELHNYLVYNRIFLSRDLFDGFDNIDKMLRESILEVEYADPNRPTDKPWRKWKERSEAIDSMLLEIENLVQMRLHYSEAE